MKKNLLIVDACVRQADSRTLRIAEPILKALEPHFASSYRYLLPEMEDIAPLTPKTFAERGEGKVPAWAADAAKRIASADAIVIIAPFWDMSFPAVLKCFFEQTSLYGITFEDNGTTCVGLCKRPPVLYITSRGMDIKTGSAREQATPYLKALGSLWGLGRLTTIAATNMDYCTPDELEAKIALASKEGVEAVERLIGGGK